MDLVVGTSAGVFCGADVRQASGIGERVVRHVIHVDGTLLAAASDGVYRSSDAGRSWTRSGVDAGEVWNLGVCDSSVYAGTQPAHLFVSRDAGQSWREVDSFLQVPDAERWCLPNSPTGARALALAFDPFDAARMWVGVEVGGVISTSDAGEHWSGTWVGPNADVHLLAPHPAKAGVLFATTGAGRNDGQPLDTRISGPYRSDDGGRTWRYLGSSMNPHYTRAFCIDPRPPHVLTVPAVPEVRSTINDPGGAKCVLFRSDDDGATWRTLGDEAHSPSAARMTAIAPDPSVVGGVLVGTETGEIWRVSSDCEWTRLVDGLPAVQALLPL